MASQFFFFLFDRGYIMKQEIREMIDQAKALGLTVYGPDEITSYFWVTRDGRIGYAQWDRVSGPSFSTVHKPNKYTGTGFKTDSFEGSLAYAPAWAGQRESIQKYGSFEAFQKQHWQNLVQY
jgi:hypothetical protein